MGVYSAAGRLISMAPDRQNSEQSPHPVHRDASNPGEEFSASVIAPVGQARAHPAHPSQELLKETEKVKAFRTAVASASGRAFIAFKSNARRAGSDLSL